MMRIAICPSCGSPRIQQAQKDWSGEFQGQSYTVPALIFYECPDCGERLYDRQAMRKIEAFSPAFTQTQKPTPSRHAPKIVMKRKKKPVATT